MMTAGIALSLLGSYCLCTLFIWRHCCTKGYFHLGEDDMCASILSPLALPIWSIIIGTDWLVDNKEELTLDNATLVVMKAVKFIWGA